MRKSVLFATAAMMAALAAAPASAADWNFTFAGTGFTGSGVFTTVDTATPTGGYLITNTVGSATVGNNTLTFTGPTTYLGADNLLYANSTPYLSFNGTSFTLSNGTSINLFYNDNLGAYRILRSVGAGLTLTSFTVTAATAAVPETATWAMMIAGFGMVGGAMRYRRRAEPKLAFARA